VNRVTLIVGGARSGKTRHAQKLAAKAAGEKGLVCYIATATAGDAEMSERIARHALDRPKHWRTIEEPLDVAAALDAAIAGFADSQNDADVGKPYRSGPLPAQRVVVIDCLTMFLTNHLLACGDGLSAVEALGAERAADDLAHAVRAVDAEVIVVANEVGLGIVPENALARVFRDVAGRANQRIAEAADQVILMVAGVPVKVKP